MSIKERKSQISSLHSANITLVAEATSYESYSKKYDDTILADCIHTSKFSYLEYLRTKYDYHKLQYTKELKKYDGFISEKSKYHQSQMKNFSRYLQEAIAEERLESKEAY